MNNNYLVGLTGGIGSGKSTVASVFKRLGVKVVDADQASRAVVEPESETLKTIIDHFKGETLLVDGQLNRSALRDIIFNNPEHKAWLEGLLHPLINGWISQQLEQPTTSPYVILESPLLFETNQYKMINTSLLVDVSPEQQIARASQRDRVNKSQIQAIIDTQMSREQKVELADFIFDNSLAMNSIEKRVIDFHSQFEALAQSK
ncbi:MAG: Dephospho-CoA kinase [Cellvibrionales bacterium UBA7375]|nr:MAG: Dephospho-CoA kinase [Cellvibrionales bacterium UBA7375]|tara:strand:- start:875 stop:1486 length:612 start_codon:yes stop_codon:yes gene_type:complete